MDKSKIISDIEYRIKSKTGDYSSWTIGISDTPKIKKDQHDNEGKDVDNWKDWSTDSKKDALYIEGKFLDKGMRGDAGEDGKASYLYIF